MPPTLSAVNDPRLAAMRAEIDRLRLIESDPTATHEERDYARQRRERLPGEYARKAAPRTVTPISDWREALDGQPGAYAATPNNVAIALEQSPEWAGALAWDEFAFKATVDRNVLLELRRREPVTISTGDLPEHAAHHVQSWLDSQGMPRVGKELVWDTVAAVCRRRVYHPVREYLLDVWRRHPMTWDEARQKLSGLWSDYFAVDVPDCDVSPGQRPDGCLCMSCDRYRAIGVAGVCWPVSAVARILPGEYEDAYRRPDVDTPGRKFGPGCLVKYVPVLTGDQDYAKSQAIDALSPRTSWVLDSRLKLDQAKDLGEMFRAKWLAEISELDGYVRGHDGAILKAAISTRVETFRDAYARQPSDHPRQCVMIGTCNPVQFLRDPDNTVRYWVLQVARPIDIERIARDRDIIWAAAVTCYVNGENWWPARGVEASSLRRVAEEAIELPSWADRLISWLSAPWWPQDYRFATLTGDWPSKDVFRFEDIIRLSGIADSKPPPRDHEVRKVLQYVRWTSGASYQPDGHGTRVFKVWKRSP